MNLGLKGKRALVTGSTAGIGFATARSLATERAHVTVNGRTETRVSRAVDQLRRELSGATIDGIAADLSTGKGCQALIDQLPEVDVLVNNLGIFEPKPFEQIPEREFFATAHPSSVLQRFTTPDEVAAMIAYVSSIQASATTRTALRVDGGVVQAIV